MQVFSSSVHIEADQPLGGFITQRLSVNGIKLSIIDKPAWAAAPRQPDAFAQSSCLV